jgi:hypothetical protein
MTDRLDDNKAPMRPYLAGFAGLGLACALLPFAFDIAGAHPGTLESQIAFWALALVCAAIPAFIQHLKWRQWGNRD